MFFSVQNHLANEERQFSRVRVSVLSSIQCSDGVGWMTGMKTSLLLKTCALFTLKS